jgi:transcriptional regulator with XRE-family HTH domain
MKLGDRIRELRNEKNISQKALGDAIGVWQTTISQIESGENNPSWATLQKLAKYFDVTISYLLGEETQLA